MRDVDFLKFSINVLGVGVLIIINHVSSKKRFNDYVININNKIFMYISQIGNCKLEFKIPCFKACILFS